ncbi:MAG TPA: hypothetical protein VGE01_04345 [Fimbriimonas sp.]
MKRNNRSFRTFLPQRGTNMNHRNIALGFAVVLAAGVVAQDDEWRPLGQRGREPERGRPSPEYREAIRRTAEMVSDANALQLVERHGLSLINLTWEDTGRYKGSAVGPNISDMTIQVAAEGTARAMPVIRFPNFEDKTTDIDPRDFTLLVGNEKGRALQRVSLYDYLASPASYMSQSGLWRGPSRSLLADRDTRVLVSAQACFLPIPRTGQASFNPVLFNYQSVEGDPAVLTILSTRQGTSMTVIDNRRDAFREGAVWGQRLFFNKNGQRSSLTGERLSDFKRSGKEGSGRSDDGLSMVLLIQVPLKQRNPIRGGGGLGGSSMDYINFDPSDNSVVTAAKRSDVEQAVIGHGRVEGPFIETAGLPIDRDERFPIRVTVQFYKATSNGIVDAADVAAIRRQIDWVYSHGDGVGSLVTQGMTGRPTEYDGLKVQPRGWWEQFWQRYEGNMGMSRAEAIARLRKILGKDYLHRPVSDLYLRDLIRRKA